MKKILFVCVHNAGRSRMAEAFFKHFARGKALAFSAGTRPEPVISPRTVKLMREVGIELDGHKPKLLTPEMLAEADRVITMGCAVEDACPASTVPTEDWGLGNPKDRPLAEARKIRDKIKEKVLELIEEL
jgi:arsenate reductase